MTTWARFSLLARASHVQGVLLAMTASLTGCLAPSPDDFPEPEQTPPYLNLVTADPPVGEILEVQTNDRKPFSISVRSEDRGDPLWGFLYLDLGFENEAFTGALERVDPSTLDDPEPRALSFIWSVLNVSPGCHQLTLLVAHESNFDLADTLKPIPGKSQGDVAVVTWWALVDRIPATPGTDCPAGPEP
jgi:hypothetical protein